MPLASMSRILQDAFQERYGVAAFNIVNDLTMSAVLAAAAEKRDLPESGGFRGHSTPAGS